MNMNYRFAQYLSTLKCYDFLVIMKLFAESIHEKFLNSIIDSLQ